MFRLIVIPLQNSVPNRLNEGKSFRNPVLRDEEPGYKESAGGVCYVCRRIVEANTHGGGAVLFLEFRSRRCLKIKRL